MEEKLPPEIEAEIERRLTLLENDPERRAQFDLDGDGSLSDEEWELARRTIRSEVWTEHRQEQPGRVDEENDARSDEFAAPPDGDRLQGRYECVEVLGTGGQGVSRLAVDHERDQKVVVKELNLRELDDWKSYELFEREAETLRTLEHPAIPSYVDHFEIEQSDGHSRYALVRQYADGETLADAIDRGRRFDEAQVRDLVGQLLETLTYLHGLNPPVVHRDIKPSNLVVTDGGSLQLIDFGAVQRVLPDEVGGSTVVGTSGYMPPEQLMGRAGPATDLYAVGATAVHLVGHRHPSELPMNRMQLEYREFVDISPAFAGFLDRMLAPTPEDRPRSAGRALERVEGLDSDAPRGVDRSAGPPSPVEVPRVTSPGLKLVGDSSALRMRLPGTRSWLKAALWTVPAVAFGPAVLLAFLAVVIDSPALEFTVGPSFEGIIFWVLVAAWAGLLALSQATHRTGGTLEFLGDRYRFVHAPLGLPLQVEQGQVDELRRMESDDRRGGNGTELTDTELTVERADGERQRFATRLRGDDARALVDATNRYLDGHRERTKRPADLGSYDFATEGLTVDDGEDRIRVDLPGTRSHLHNVLWNVPALAFGPYASEAYYELVVYFSDAPHEYLRGSTYLVVFGLLWLGFIAFAQLPHRWGGTIEFDDDHYRLRDTVLGLPLLSAKGNLGDLEEISHWGSEFGDRREPTRMTLALHHGGGSSTDFVTRMRPDDAEMLVAKLRRQLDDT